MTEFDRFSVCEGCHQRNTKVKQLAGSRQIKADDYAGDRLVSPLKQGGMLKREDIPKDGCSSAQLSACHLSTSKSGRVGSAA